MGKLLQLKQLRLTTSLLQIRWANIPVIVIICHVAIRKGCQLESIAVYLGQSTSSALLGFSSPDEEIQVFLVRFKIPISLLTGQIRKAHAYTNRLHWC